MDLCLGCKGNLKVNVVICFQGHKYVSAILTERLIMILCFLRQTEKAGQMPSQSGCRDNRRGQGRPGRTGRTGPLRSHAQCQGRAGVGGQEGRIRARSGPWRMSTNSQVLSVDISGPGMWKRVCQSSRNVAEGARPWCERPDVRKCLVRGEAGRRLGCRLGRISV